MATKTGSNFFAPQGAAVQIALTDENGLAVLAKCTGSLPTTANTFQHGCIMIKTDSGTGTKALYENVGTSASPSWNLIGETTAGEITLSNGKVLIGNASNVAAEQTISGDITITNAGVATIGSAKVNKTKLSYETATLVFGATDTIKDATITTGSIVIGQYVSDFTGTPATKHCKLSISGTTLTGTLDAAPGTGNALTITVVLLKA